jgi:hypothetical protein
MALTTISGEIQAQPLNDNFSYLNSEVEALKTDEAYINVMAPPSPLVAAKGDWNGSTGTDDTVAINACLQYVVSAGGGTVLLPGGRSYAVSDALLMDGDNLSIISIGSPATIINTSADKDTIQLGGYRSYLTLRNLILDRVPTATGTCAGVKQVSSLSMATIENVVSTKNRYGFWLGHTDASLCRRIVASFNALDGILLTPHNIAQDAALQWNFEMCNLSSNGHNGFNCDCTGAVAATTRASLGTLNRVDTYANGNSGITFAGKAACTINGARVYNCFIGEDVQSGIVFDTYGGGHKATNCFIELENNYGIYASTNNSDISIVGCKVDGCKLNGIRTLCEKVFISATNVTNNCATLGATQKIGVALENNNSNFVGGFSGNTTPANNQEYGIILGGANCSCVGAVFEANTVAPIYFYGANGIAQGIGGPIKLSNRGTATITSAATTVTVTHSIGITPAISDIQVTPTNSMGTAAKYWIDTVTATTFNVNVNAAPGATTATFNWSIDHN